MRWRIGVGSGLVLVGDALFAGVKVGAFTDALQKFSVDNLASSSLSLTANAFLIAGFSAFCFQKALDIRQCFASPYSEKAKHSHALHRVNLALPEALMTIGSFLKSFSNPAFLVDTGSRLGAWASQLLDLSQVDEFKDDVEKSKEKVKPLKLIKNVAEIKKMAVSNLVGKELLDFNKIKPATLEKMRVIANEFRVIYNKCNEKTNGWLAKNHDSIMTIGTASPGFILLGRNAVEGNVWNAALGGLICLGYVVTNIAPRVSGSFGMEKAEVIQNKDSLKDMSDALFTAVEKLYLQDDKNIGKDDLYKVGQFMKRICSCSFLTQPAQSQLCEFMIDKIYAKFQEQVNRDEVEDNMRKGHKGSWQDMAEKAKSAIPSLSRAA